MAPPFPLSPAPSVGDVSTRALKHTLIGFHPQRRRLRSCHNPVPRLSLSPGPASYGACRSPQPRSRPHTVQCPQKPLAPLFTRGPPLAPTRLHRPVSSGPSWRVSPAPGPTSPCGWAGVQVACATAPSPLPHALKEETEALREKESYPRSRRRSGRAGYRARPGAKGQWAPVP